MRKIHVDAKVDEQTMLFFYIQAFLLPEDEVTEDFESFFISHPFNRFKIKKELRNSKSIESVETLLYLLQLIILLFQRA